MGSISQMENKQIMCSVAVEREVITNKCKMTQAMWANMGTNAHPYGKSALKMKAYENTCI